MDTNILTDEILSMMAPRVALIAYENQTDRGDKHFLEMRQIDDDGAMGAGAPVTYEFLNEIAETYSGKNTTTPSGAIPANLLYADTRKGSEKLIWWNPPCKRAMYFAQKLGVTSGEYHVPGVIYEAREGELNIYAFKDDAPYDKTKLYYGPFFNTTQSNVCLGTSTLKRPLSPTFEQMQIFWEDRFWRTTFTHLGGADNPTHDNLVLVTNAAADKPFDLAQLKPTGKTLKDLLK